MKITDIVKNYLTANGFDGLYTDEDVLGEECCCSIKDLFACDEVSPNCKSGVFTRKPKDEQDISYLIGAKDDNHQP